MPDNDPIPEHIRNSIRRIKERKSLGERVLETLRHAIIRGDYAPGARLVESRIAEALGISRTPVREAIHKLEREGFLEKKIKGGYVVLGLTREDIEETFGIRSVLESYAARLAAEKHAPGDLIALERKITEFRVRLAGGRLAELTSINTEFHDMLYALSRSPKLIQMIGGLRDQIYRFRKIILEKEEPARRSSDDHQQMLAAIKARDADGVERLVREHILRGRDVVLAEFDRKSSR